MYPIEKYRFIQTGNKTIAISTYAGKTVRGTAKCDPHDTVDAELGKTIAALRCAKKIAKRRVARANKKVSEAEHMLEMAKRRYDAMVNYAADADMAESYIDGELKKLLS